MHSDLKCMYPRRVDLDMVNSLPLLKYTGEIVFIDSIEIFDKEFASIKKEIVLGFDTETRPSFQKGKQYPVSILQLASDKKAWVIKLGVLADRFDKIFGILASDKIKKVGLAVKGDIVALQRLYEFTPNGFADIAASTTKIGIINTGMRNLVALFFGKKISKSAQLTNWASPELTKRQLNYAATDAWVSRILFLEVEKVIFENNFVLEPEFVEPEKFNLKTFIKNVISGILKKISKKSASKTSKKVARKSPKKSPKKRLPTQKTKNSTSNLKKKSSLK